MIQGTAVRCYDHKGRVEIPPLCHTCQRLSVESDIVARTIDAMLSAGYFLQTDLRDSARPETPTRDRDTILSEMMETDDEFLGVFECATDELPLGWVRFVYGNDGWDVISDYTVNLESILKPVNEYADTLC